MTSSLHMPGSCRSPQCVLGGAGGGFQAAGKIGMVTTDACHIKVWISRMILSLTQTFLSLGVQRTQLQECQPFFYHLKCCCSGWMCTALLGASLAYTMLFIYAVTHLHVSVLSLECPSVFLALNYHLFQNSSKRTLSHNQPYRDPLAPEVSRALTLCFHHCCGHSRTFPGFIFLCSQALSSLKVWAR